MTDFFEQVQSLANTALLSELNTKHKYGLVCPDTNGSHLDMDYAVMKNGITALTPFFGQFTKMGFEADAATPDLLQSVRKVGLEAEKSMFLATNGINTHKGALFCLGLVCVATGFVKKTKGKVSAKSICDTVKSMCQGLCEKELKSQDGELTKTHGAEVFLKYNSLGARGLAEDGYSQAIKVFLPTLKRLYASCDKDTAHSRLLALIVSTTEDGNILFRGDKQILCQAQQRCKALYKNYSVQEAEKTNQWFVSQNISAGGSADLLSLTIFLCGIQQIKG